MSFSPSTRLAPSISHSTRALAQRPQGIRTLRPYPYLLTVLSGDGHSTGAVMVERVRDHFTNTEYILVSGQGQGQSQGETSVIKESRSTPSNSKSGSSISQNKNTKYVCLFDNTLLKLDNKPRVTSEGTTYFGKTMNTVNTRSESGNTHRQSPILTALSKEGNLGKCLGLNVFIPNANPHDQSEGQKGRQVEFRSLYALLGRDSHGSVVEMLSGFSTPVEGFVGGHDEDGQIPWYNPMEIQHPREESEIFPAGVIPLSEIAQSQSPQSQG
ncbi:hypothetical protein I302_107385 [Kwoniella bestiolae CBS 10118]|uniref:Uncharacterized protein n=1 Tax=Kwoniella bestiolae CBS 10118 TaxID=1296100 RepID=A0A1B9FYR0_9TREE|nr:hypothetical protein I302_06877 [Kwoniella bestiolae CBS 10118]OCF23891.1 hypothetical protein I302_06877 [Kwoniella bestiolae CBS 10118]